MEKLYKYIMVLAMVGILGGIVLTVLGTLAASSGLTNKAVLGINKTVDVIYSIPNVWLPIIVIVAVAGIVIYMVARFGSGGRG